jgi:hypothetical protein
VDALRDPKEIESADEKTGNRVAYYVKRAELRFDFLLLFAPLFYSILERMKISKTSFAGSLLRSPLFQLNKILPEAKSTSKNTKSTAQNDHKKMCFTPENR